MLTKIIYFLLNGHNINELLPFRSSLRNFNTLSKHLPYIFGWRENEEDEEAKADQIFTSD